MFIELEVKTAIIVHGFDNNNHEIIENIIENEFTKKLISLDRIKSISEKYVLVTSAFGRQMYWEYNCSFEELKALLNNNSLIVK